MLILFLIFLCELFEVYRLVCDILGTLLVGLQAECVTTFVHVHGAETEAEDVEFACLARALPIALSINHLFILTTLSDFFNTWFQTCTIMINHSFGAYRCTHIAFGHSEARRARRVPLFITLLTVSALLRLAVATPERERLLATFGSFFEELRAAVVVLIFPIASHISGFLIIN